MYRRSWSAGDAVRAVLEVTRVAPRPGDVAADGDRQVVPPVAGLERVDHVRAAAVRGHAERLRAVAGVVVRRDRERHVLGAAVGQLEDQPGPAAGAVRVVGRLRLRGHARGADVAGEATQEAVRADDRDVVFAGAGA